MSLSVRTPTGKPGLGNKENAKKRSITRKTKRKGKRKRKRNSKREREREGLRTRTPLPL